MASHFHIFLKKTLISEFWAGWMSRHIQNYPQCHHDHGNHDHHHHYEPQDLDRLGGEVGGNAGCGSVGYRGMLPIELVWLILNNVALCQAALSLVFSDLFLMPSISLFLTHGEP